MAAFTRLAALRVGRLNSWPWSLAHRYDAPMSEDDFVGDGKVYAVKAQSQASPFAEKERARDMLPVVSRMLWSEKARLVLKITRPRTVKGRSERDCSYGEV